MNDFNLCLNTDIRFGKGKIRELKEILKQYGKNVLLVYGGQSLKQNGIYEEIVDALDGQYVVELPGIEPNPKIESVEKGVNLCKENNIDLILAAGGGSVIDASKAIAAAVYYEGEPWDMIKKRKKISKAIPIVTVLTICATGSEMNPTAVISNMKTNEKLVFASPEVIPKVSICDPTYLYSLPVKQTLAGTADIMSHVMEQYFQENDGAYITDCLCESVLRTCIKYCPIAIEHPRDYEARSNLMWASTLGLNGILSCGKGGGWSCHNIEHELSAFYDITHGIGLAIVTPRWMRYILNDSTVERFCKFSKNVWDVPDQEDRFAMAEAGIKCLEDFWTSFGMPMTLKDTGIDLVDYSLLAQRAMENGHLDGNVYVPLNQKDVENILQMCNE